MLSILIHIPSYLRAYCENHAQVSVQVDRPIVREALEALRTQHPGVIGRVLDETGKPRRHVNVFVNEQNVRDLNLLETPLQPKDELFIIPSVTGGTDDPKSRSFLDLPVSDCSKNNY